MNVIERAAQARTVRYDTRAEFRINGSICARAITACVTRYNMRAPIAKLMHSLLSQSTAYQECPWEPLMDIYRGTRGWLVKLDLAGVQTDDVDLYVSGRQLTIEGLRRDRSIVEGHQAYSMEIAYNRFQRKIEFPCDIESAQIFTKYDNGMLLVQLLIEPCEP